MSKIKAIIFDMDGVLIDAREWHYEALNKALSFFGLSINRYDHLTSFDGLPTKKKLDLLSLEGSLPKGLHKIINDLKQKFTLEQVYTKCNPTFHHQYALGKLKSDGFQLVVCSNAIKRSIEIMLERADLLKYLNFYLSNEDVIQPKPDPEIYIKAIEKLNLIPTECLILEDNDNGIKAAIASGANLMTVVHPDDVTYLNIIKYINIIYEKNEDNYSYSRKHRI